MALKKQMNAHAVSLLQLVPSKQWTVVPPEASFCGFSLQHWKWRLARMSASSFLLSNRDKFSEKLHCWVKGPMAESSCFSTNKELIQDHSLHLPQRPWGLTENQQRWLRERTPNSVYSYHSVGYGKVCSLWFLTVAKKTVYSPFVYRHFLRLLECLKSKFYSEKLSSVHVFAHIVVNPCLFSPEALTVSTLLCCIFPDILNILPC